MITFDSEKIENLIIQSLNNIGFFNIDTIPLREIPFSGDWGWATTICFKLASMERNSNKNLKVSVRAQEIAELLRNQLITSGCFDNVEAVRGYVNMHLDAGKSANRLVKNVLVKGNKYGAGEPISETIMVEYSQPNTHKAFHVGHFRNVCLGHALANILSFAGYNVITANYVGDIGLHVIKCLWGYLKFYKDQEPKRDRGKWLGEVYSEADRTLKDADKYREDIVGFIQKVIQDQSAGVWIQDQMRNHFETAVREELKNSQNIEFQRDALSVREQVYEKSPIKINSIVHHQVGDWLWTYWLSLNEQFQTLLTEKPQNISWVSETDYQGLIDLREEYLKIGFFEDRWKYASEIRELFSLWEEKDPKLINLWNKTRQWSLDDFQIIYNQLEAPFDVWYFESEVEDDGRLIVEDLVKADIATDLRPEGPVLVKIDEKLGLEKDVFRTIAVLRADGTTLYSTKELALAKSKFENYGVDRAIYVVDVSQSLYFKQIFKILELWGFEQAKKCYHLAYEIVKLPSGKMSSREGTVVLFDDFLNEAITKAEQIVIDKKQGSIKDAVVTSEKDLIFHIALGAMKYGMLSKDTNKVINFDWDNVLNFDGHTSPYIQYAYARACSILEKGGEFSLDDVNYNKIELDPAELNLLEKIGLFPSVVQSSAQEYNSLGVAIYVYELAKSFNKFYKDCPVLKEEPNVRNARLSLTSAAKITLANGLNLLGIKPLETM